VIGTTLAEPLDSAGLRSGLPSGHSRLPATAARTSVIISIDAEIAPHTSDWRRNCGRFAADRDLYGITELGERGLRYQLDVIERHGLRAVVFLEALSAGALGLDLLAEVVGLVQDRAHEVELHIYTECLSYYKRPLRYLALPAPRTRSGLTITRSLNCSASALTSNGVAARPPTSSKKKSKYCSIRFRKLRRSTSVRT
jgi:hypothetical protein